MSTEFFVQDRGMCVTLTDHETALAERDKQIAELKDERRLANLRCEQADDQTRNCEATLETAWSERDAIKAENERLLECLENIKLQYTASRDQREMLEETIYEAVAERDALRKWQSDIIGALPVGYLQTHTPDRAVEIIKHYLCELARLESERDESRAEIERMNSTMISKRTYNSAANAVKEHIERLEAERDAARKACSCEADHQRAALESLGLAQEFPFGCDAIQHVAEALIAARKQLDVERERNEAKHGR